MQEEQDGRECKTSRFASYFLAQIQKKIFCLVSHHSLRSLDCVDNQSFRIIM